MALAFVFDWLFEPSELTLDDARDWEAVAHNFAERSGRTTLLLTSQYGHQVKVNCAYYGDLCAHVRSAGTAGLRVWVGDLGYFKSASLLQATVGGRDIVPLAAQQAAYRDNALERNLTKLFFVGLALLAWYGPRFARRLRPARAA